MRTQQLKSRTDYAAYAIRKQDIQNKVPVKSVSGMTNFNEIVQGDVYTKLDDLNFILANNSPATAVVATAPTAPTQPIFNTTTPITSTGFTVNWSGGSGATSYTYTLNSSAATPSSSTTQSATFTGLSATTTYSVIVTAVNSIGTTSSLPLSVTTLIPPPTLPILSGTTSITSSGFTVNWSGATGATSYMYTLDMSAATPSSFTATSATFTGLSANTTYSAMVTAVNIGGSTSSLRVNITTLIAAPTQPTDLSNNTITSSGFTISWSGGSGAESYTYTLNGSAAIPSSSTASSATFTGLSASTAYSVIVTAVNSTGSAVSSPLSVTTLIPAPTQPSLSLQTGSTSPSGFTVNWSGGSGADSYTYTLNGSAATPSSSTATSATFTGLASSTAYSVIVTAVNSTGSTPSSSLSVTTLIPPPTQPTFNPTTAITSTGFTVNWSGGTRATGSSGITYTVTNSGFSGYLINGTNNPTLTVIRGLSYIFSANASGHPFWIQTSAPPYNSGNVYSGGVTNGGTSVGTIIWEVPFDAPNLLYYVCQFHSSMSGTINVTDASGATGAGSYTYTLNGSAATPSSSTAQSATFTSLAANTVYSVIVTAVNSTGTAVSNPLSVTTLISPSPYA